MCTAVTFPGMTVHVRRNTRPTGIGNSWLASALAHKACLQSFSARYLRLPRLFRELAIAKGDGRYHKLLSDFPKTDLLVLDDPRFRS